jgi:hypothetical protein
VTWSPCRFGAFWGTQRGGDEGKNERRGGGAEGYGWRSVKLWELPWRIGDCCGGCEWGCGGVAEEGEGKEGKRVGGVV